MTHDPLVSWIAGFGLLAIILRAIVLRMIDASPAIVRCAERGCPERIVATAASQCEGCLGCYCERHRHHGTCADGEPRTLCLDCGGRSDEPWGPGYS